MTLRACPAGSPGAGSMGSSFMALALATSRGPTGSGCAPSAADDSCQHSSDTDFTAAMSCWEEIQQAWTSQRPWDRCPQMAASGRHPDASPSSLHAAVSPCILSTCLLCAVYAMKFARRSCAAGLTCWISWLSAGERTNFAAQAAECAAAACPYAACHRRIKPQRPPSPADAILQNSVFASA